MKLQTKFINLIGSKESSRVESLRKNILYQRRVYIHIYLINLFYSRKRERMKETAFLDLLMRLRNHCIMSFFSLIISKGREACLKNDIMQLTRHAAAPRYLWNNHRVISTERYTRYYVQSSRSDHLARVDVLIIIIILTPCLAAKAWGKPRIVRAGVNEVIFANASMLIPATGFFKLHSIH